MSITSAEADTDPLFKRGILFGVPEMLDSAHSEIIWYSLLDRTAFSSPTYKNHIKWISIKVMIHEHG